MDNIKCRKRNKLNKLTMKKLAIIGGLSLMTAGTTYMIRHPHAPQFDFNPNTLAIATGGFFVAIGITYKF